jgi:hypothetical protein
METIIRIGFFYKLTDRSNRIAEMSLTDWHNVTDALMAKFQTIDLSRIKFPGIGYGTVIDYEFFHEDTSGIIVRMRFSNVDYIPKTNYYDDFIYLYPKLFDVWYFAESNQHICKSKNFNGMKVLTNTDYIAKSEFHDIYILGYENDGVYHNIDE